VGGDFVTPELIFPDQYDGGGGATGLPAESDDSSPNWALIILVSAVVIVVAPWVVRRVLRFKHRHRGPREQIAAAWARARECAREAGVPGTPAMTGSEWSVATAHVLPVAARPMRSLAEVVDRVMYAPVAEVDLERRGTFGDRVSDDCELWANQIQRIVDDTLPGSTRLRRYFTSYT
jgi:hypothetical protein